MVDFSWTQGQQSIIEAAIDAEIENSRLAHKLIPKVDLSPNDRAVAKDKYIYPNPAAVPEIEEGIDETFVPLGQDRQVSFSLTKLQTEDTDLARALVRVRRAAQQLAWRHDHLVFRDTIWAELEGNAPAPGDAAVPGYHNRIERFPERGSPPPVVPQYGDGLVSAVAEAIAALDGQGYRTGFVLVGGQNFYTQLYTRVAGAADLPVKAVKGLLEDGPVHRSTVLPPCGALVLSINGEEIDRAVAVPPTLEFLRIGDNENREFRLYERFLPRFKQSYSAVLLRLMPLQSNH